MKTLFIFVKDCIIAISLRIFIFGLDASAYIFGILVSITRFILVGLLGVQAWLCKKSLILGGYVRFFDNTPDRKTKHTPLKTKGNVFGFGRRNYSTSTQKNFSKSNVDKFFRTIALLGALVSLGYSRKRPSLASLFKKVGFRMFGLCFSHGGKYLARMRQLYNFLRHVQNMHRHHGAITVVKYLKASQLAIQKALAGTPLTSLRVIDPTIPFPYLASCGLPRFIPLRDRKLMLVNSSPSVIRWWLTLFSVYRVIEIPGKLKLETITDGPAVSMDSIQKVTDALVKLVRPIMFPLDISRHTGKVLFLETASSSERVSWFGLVKDVMHLTRKQMFEPLITVNQLLGNWDYHRFLRYIQYGLIALKAPKVKPNDAERAIVPAGLVSPGTHTDFDPEEFFTALSPLYEPPFMDVPIGKLHIKHEAAGKERVFAMVDSHTQSSLKPIHKMLFGFLKSLPNDATFDQLASVRRCHVKARLTGLSRGFDLTAATDRLPITMQAQLLDTLIPGLGDLWTTILVNRDYRLSYKENGELIMKDLRYNTGQPMGAYSSWAMLAVTHHFIAQLAATRAQSGNGRFWITGIHLEVFNLKGPWYTGYEVLGDDIVFFEDDVAREYLLIMEELGVPINMTKSVLGENPTFEFAKVTGHKGNDVSALSWAALMSQPSLMGRACYSFALLAKGIVHKHPIRFLQCMWRESKYKLGSPSAFMVAIGTMYSKQGRIPFYDFLYSIGKRTMGAINVYKTLIEETNIIPLQRAIAQAATTDGPVMVPHPLSRKRGWRLEEFEIRTNLNNVIVAFLYGVNRDNIAVTPINPEVDAMRTAQAILTHEKVGLCPAALNANPLVYSWQSDLIRKANFSPVEEYLHNLFCVLSKQIFDNLYELYMEILDSQDDPMGLQMEQLLDIIDKIDRYKEVTQISKRADTKLKEESIPLRNLVDSPLEALRILCDDMDPEAFYSGGSTWYLDLPNYMYVQAQVERLPGPREHFQFGNIPQNGALTSYF